MTFLAEKSKYRGLPSTFRPLVFIPEIWLNFHHKDEPAMQVPVSSSPFHHVRQRAFTLIEVLVVITITSLLMGILIPALSRGRAHAQQLMCSSSMRQTAMLTTIYAQDNAYYLPHATNYPTDPTKNHLAWSQVIDLTDPSTKLRRCPGTGSTRFFWATKTFGPFVPGSVDETPNLRYHAPNANFMTRSDQYAAYPFKKLSLIKKNHNRLMLATDIGGTDSAASQRFGGGYITAEGPRYRHGSGDVINLSFLDGHAESWTTATTYEAYLDFFVRTPRVYNPKLILTDNSTDYYPWGDNSALNPN
jgi:prepilin-type N-terminal cleavage/methylation domain-containing protein/prepilin-type processing-associated H-X9-DG protein